MNDSPNNPETNDPDISANLRRVVPDDLMTSGLVAGARSKRRRLHRVVGAVAALALVAVAVPVALNLPTNDALIAEPAVTSPSLSPSIEDPEKAVLPGAQACYNDDRTPINHSQDTNGPAQPGAVKAWLCGDYSPDTGAGFIGPHDPLTSGIDELLEGMQSEAEVDLAVISCPAEYNLSFNVVLEYEDGTRSIVGGDRHGCRLTYDGGVAREDGDKFYGEAVSAWETQRETDDGDWVVPHICPGPLSLIEMERSDVAQASVCGEKEDGSWGADYLGEDLVVEISEDLEASYAAHAENDFVEVPEQRVWLTLSDAFTDYQTFVRHEDGRYHSYDGEGRKWFWNPSADLSVKLDEALAGAGTTDAPPTGRPVEGVEDSGPDDPVIPMPTQGQGWISEGCQAVTSADVQASSLDDGSLPPSPERILLCGNGATVGPWEQLVAADLTSRAVEAFNALEEVDPESTCSAEAGNSHLVVLEYPDGVSRVLEVGLLGCRGIRTGDQVRSGGADYLDTLIGLWEEQRGAQPLVVDRPGQLCPQVWSVFEVDPLREEFTDGRACIGWEREGAAVVGPAEESVLPAELVADLSRQLNTMTTVENWGRLSGDSLVLITAAGDPFTIQRIDGEGFLVSDDMEDRVWIPTGDVAERLEKVFSN